MKKISIITVSYNCEKTIVDTIKSVNSQSYRNNVEYIIVDGSSSDNTIKLIKEHESAVDKWITEKDNGIYDAMNKGLKMATGEWIGFLHADDVFFSSNVIENMIDQTKAYGCNCIYGNLNYIQEEPPHKIVRFWKSQNYSPKLIKRGWMPPHPTVYIKRELIEKIGFFNTSYQISADYDYMLRLFTHSETQSLFIDKTLVNMKLGGVSNNSVSNIIKKSKEDYKALTSNKVGGLYALFIKNFSKIAQFFSK